MKPRQKLTCSAPGKLFLGGEYAVLRGATAVVTAVDRRAVAFVAKNDEHESPFVTAVYESVDAHLKKKYDIRFTLPKVGVKSSGFRIDHHKLGLGSSAAVTAAAAGLLFELAGLPVSDHIDDILITATAAHRTAQKGKGSGADVAAAVLGGTILFSIDDSPRQIMFGKETRIKDLEIVTVWTGSSASTSEMIAQINRFKQSDSDTHASCFHDLAAGATKMANAFSKENIAHIIAAARDYAGFMDALGRASGTPIITRELRQLINLAESFGGAAKPSGAGGGDIAVAFFDNQDAAHQFRKHCIRYELRPLDLKVNTPGVKKDFDQESRGQPRP